MKNLLDNLNEIDSLIRRLHIMESEMRSGQFIEAWRNLCGVIANLNRAKQKLVAEAEAEKTDAK